MNHDCNGDYFIAEGKKFYRCMVNLKLIPADDAMRICPCCGRNIIAGDHGVVQVTTRATVDKIAILPNGCQIMISSSISDRSEMPEIIHHEKHKYGDDYFSFISDKTRIRMVIALLGITTFACILFFINNYL
ncbi:hypothetical protein [Pectobacterium carotovorum]|uniref:hypothetical protein n=1 Tax=Pectobacterium carotovorum TaxID=554 RepID=UPI000505B180|nr:hypothetical protein [Pectobacterium carotovorum]KFW97580.1 hypothetical protein JV33_21495 [Pectobacterium carotovorum subsp. carotovorum]KML64950.1 hypothetical protein G032_21025 [Pectobacterium carotovorum subsp. carotovorum ICMP 5702]SHH68359.1 hypothetical protein SAMN05444147_11618 [Pectobacterium carotovorum]